MNFVRLTAAFAVGITIAQVAQSRADDTLPSEFTEFIQPLLTPLETVEKLPEAPNGIGREEADAEYLLLERLYWVGDDGRVVVARHTIGHPITEAGIDWLRDDSARYSKEDQRVWLTNKRTIHPERGEILPGDEAIFTEKIGTGSSDIHSDSERLKVIFPDVVPGAQVESVFVIETHAPTIPNEFATRRPIGTHLPMRRQRMVVEVPAKMAERLRWHFYGGPQSKPVRTELPSGRVRFDWSADQISPFIFEPGRPSPYATGPAMVISSLPDWDAIGRWFTSFLEPLTEEQSEEMQTLADTWGADSKDSAVVARALYEKVRDEVRYTGLEFGKGAFCPRPPHAVIDTKFGDCKDKSNLLRVLLEKRGIASRMVLLDTDGPGVIERTLPTHHPFNHAILAVDLDDGTVFCDPTAVGVPFRTLPTSSAGREVLVISSDGKTEWTTTPEAAPARFEISAKLNLEPGRGFSGWIDLRSTGVPSGRIAELVGKGDHANVLGALDKISRGLHGAKVIDFAPEKYDPDTQTLDLRFYVVKVGSPIDGSAAREQIAPLILGDFLPPVESERERHTEVYGHLKSTKLSARFIMQDDWTVLDLPAAFEAEVPGYSVAGSWSENGQDLVCEFEARQTKSTFSAIEHPAIWDVTRQLADWLRSPAIAKRPAILADGEEVLEEIFEVIDSTPWTPDPASLPMLPNPKGQKLLITTRFPFDMASPFEADHTARKIAFNKMIEQFPDDPEVQFDGGLFSILSDFYNLEFEGLDMRADALIDKWRDQLSPEKICAGEVALASTFWLNDRAEEALALATSVVSNDDAPTLVRQAAAAIAASIYDEEGDERAIPMATMSMDLKLQPAESLQELAGIRLWGIAKAAPDGKKVEEVVREWQKIREQRPDSIESLRESFQYLAYDLFTRGRHAEVPPIIDALEKVVKEEGWGEEALEDIQANRENQAEVARCQPLAEKIQAWLEKNPWPDLEKMEEDDFAETAFDFYELLDYYWRDYAIWTRYSLRSLVGYDAQPDFVDNLDALLAELSDWLDAHADPVDPTDDEVPEPPESAENLIDLLTEIRRELLSELDKENALIESVEVATVRRRKGEGEANALERKYIDDTRLPPNARATLINDLARQLAEQNRFEERLELTRKLESKELAEVDWCSVLYLVSDTYLALAIKDPRGKPRGIG